MATGSLNKEQRNPFMPTTTLRKSQNMQATRRLIFSGSEKKYIEQSRLSVKSVLALQNKKRRAPWDLKGKLQDEVTVNYDLMEKCQEMEEREKILVEEKQKLEVATQQCTEDAEKHNKIITVLKQKLCDVTNEVEVAKKERDEAVFETQHENQKLRGINKRLKSRVASLEMKNSDVSNSLAELHLEYSHYSLYLSKVQEELKKLRNELKKCTDVYEDTKSEWEIMEQQYERVLQTIRKMKAGNKK